MPASRQARRSSSKALAVSATTGRRHAPARSVRAASMPQKPRHAHVHQHQVVGAGAQRLERRLAVGDVVDAGSLRAPAARGPAWR